jgi:hypothetical protein
LVVRVRESIVSGPMIEPSKVLTAVPDTTPLTACEPAKETGTSGVPQ